MKTYFLKKNFFFLSPYIWLIFAAFRFNFAFPFFFCSCVPGFWRSVPVFYWCIPDFQLFIERKGALQWRACLRVLNKQAAVAVAKRKECQITKPEIATAECGF